MSLPHCVQGARERGIATEREEITVEAAALHRPFEAAPAQCRACPLCAYPLQLLTHNAETKRFLACCSRKAMSSPQRVIIDTDPGCDDTLALLLALSSREKMAIEVLLHHHWTIAVPPSFLTMTVSRACALYVATGRM